MFHWLAVQRQTGKRTHREALQSGQTPSSRREEYGGRMIIANLNTCTTQRTEQTTLNVTLKKIQELTNKCQCATAGEPKSSPAGP